jgi:hypothetical protein
MQEEGKKDGIWDKFATQKKQTHGTNHEGLIFRFPQPRNGLVYGPYTGA